MNNNPLPTGTPVTPEHPAAPRQAGWFDIVLVIVVGFGAFIALGLLLTPLFQQSAILGSATTYLANVTSFTGAVALIGFARKRLTAAQIGLWPARPSWKWLAIAAGLALLLIPLRVGLALLVQVAVGGGMDELAGAERMEILAPQGSLALNFLVTLVLGGLVVPVAEELFFRGAIFTWLRQRLPLWPAVLISGAVFALGHLDLAAVVATSFVIGVLNAWLLEKTRSIWVPIAVHVVNNSTAIVLLYGALAAQQLLGQG